MTGTRSLGVATLLVLAACGNAPGESQPPLAASAAPPAESSEESGESDSADLPATTLTTAPPPSPPPPEPPTDTEHPSGSPGSVEGDEAMARAMRLARRVAEASPPSSEDEEVYVLFEWRYVTSRVRDCVVLAPGEDVVFSAEGFAPGSLVEVEQVGRTVALVDLSLPALGSVRVDAAGRLEFVWTVPQAPPAWLDPLPRGYFVKATGTDASGEVLAARPVSALGVYPGTPPCAVDDAASTTVGQAVRIGVLGNDVAPSGGSLDPASLKFRSVDGGVHGGRVVVDPTGGSVVYTPDPGFVGGDVFEYEVRDNWGSRVRARVTVTVDAE